MNLAPTDILANPYTLSTPMAKRPRQLRRFTFRVIGLDSEVNRGRVIVLCSSGVPNAKTGKFMRPSKILYPSFEQAVDFLWKSMPISKKKLDKIGGFWNIKYDFSVLFKNWFKKITNLEEWLDTCDRGFDVGEIVGERVSQKGGVVPVHRYHISFIHGKGFTITRYYPRKDNPKPIKKTCYDISDFYKNESGKSSLENAAEHFLSEHKKGDVDRERLGEDEQYWLDHQDETIEYCIQDCQLTSKLGSKMVRKSGEIIHQFAGEQFWPKYYYSCAGLSKALLEAKHPELQDKFFLFDWKVIEMSWLAYQGAHTEVRKFGRQEGISRVDISQAYPHAISKLPKLDLLEAREVTEAHDDAVIGIYRILVRYNGKIPCKKEDGTVYCPIGLKRLPDYVTNIGLKYFRERGCDLEVVEGIEFFYKGKKSNHTVQPGHRCSESCKRVLQFPETLALYEERSKEKKLKNEDGDEHDLTQWFIKQTMAAEYGVLASNKHSVSSFTNFIYASLVTEHCRVTIWKLCDRIGWENVTFIFTDAVAYIDKGQLTQSDIMKELGGLEKDIDKTTMITYECGLYTYYSNKNEDGDNHDPDLDKRKFCSCADEGIEDEDSECQCANRCYVKCYCGKDCFCRWRLKKRGAPSLTVRELFAAQGHVLKVARFKARTLFEGIREKKWDEVGQFYYEEKEIDLWSNKDKRDFKDDALLTFEVFNSRSVDSYPLEIEDQEYHPDVPSNVSKYRYKVLERLLSSALKNRKFEGEQNILEQIKKDEIAFQKVRDILMKILTPQSLAVRSSSR